MNATPLSEPFSCRASEKGLCIIWKILVWHTEKTYTQKGQCFSTSSAHFLAWLDTEVQSFRGHYKLSSAESNSSKRMWASVAWLKLDVQVFDTWTESTCLYSTSNGFICPCALSNTQSLTLSEGQGPCTSLGSRNLHQGSLENSLWGHSECSTQYFNNSNICACSLKL